MRLTDEQIGAELQALREVPSERFAAELDAWAAEGFPTIKQLEPTRRRFQFLRRRPVLAAAGSLTVVAVVAVSVAAYLNGNDVRTDSGGEPIDGVQEFSTKVESAPRAAAGTAAGTDSAVAPAPLPPTGTRPRNGLPQVHERSASLGLATDADKLQDTADGVIQVTDRYDGFVDSSTVHVGGSRGHASFALRIPTAHLNDAMSDLSDLGHVTSSDTGSTNVTGSYADAVKAYRDAQAKVESLLGDLQNAPSPSEAASIKQQLVVAREQLAAARAALRGFKQHVALTPVNVQITAQGDGNWSIGDAADDAVGVLEAIGGAMLIALAVLVPLSALVALAWFGTRGLQRRRRESSLDR
jgi:Domain of unknown function (DUF4349)